MLKGVNYILNNDSGVQSSLGLNKVGSKYKVYPLVAPEPEKVPYCTTVVTGRDPLQCKAGAITSSIYRFDVRSYNTSYDDLVTLNEAVVTALNQETGSINGVSFGRILFVDERDDHVIYGSHTIFIKVSSFTAEVHG